MSNDYYNVTTDLTPFTKARSNVIDTEMAGIEAAFDLLPSLAQTRSANTSFVAAGGTANAITVNHPITAWSTYTGKDGHKINIQITTVNTGAVTLAVDGLSAKACKRNDGSALQAGDLAANGFYDFIYDEAAGYFVVPEAINGVLAAATAQASAASSSASAASSSASAATTQASTATTQAGIATTQAGIATTKASEASASAILAQQWASNPEDDDVSGGEFSAKHYAIKAAASAATAGGNVAGQINGATAKSPLVDNDEFGIADSAASYGLKKALWSTIKSGIWTALGTLINGGTAKTTVSGNDLIAIADSAASNASKKITVTTLFTDPTITGTIKEDIYAITDGAAFEIDPGNGSVQTVTLGANRTPKGTNFENGESVVLGVDDGTSRTLTWTDATFGGSGVVWETNSGSAPTLDATGYTWIVLWKVSGQVYGAKVGG